MSQTKRIRHKIVLKGIYKEENMLSETLTAVSAFLITFVSAYIINLILIKLGFTVEDPSDDPADSRGWGV